MTNIIDDILAPHTAQLDVKLLSPSARLPTAGSAHAAGLDLYAAEQKTIPARGKALVNTQISVAVPVGHYGRVAPRSGLASKHGIQTGAGVIDADYRGPVMVLLFNHSETDFEVNEGDRIAQLILERISHARVNQVEELDSTVRGAGGFGSTGGFGVKRPRVEEAVSAASDAVEAVVDKVAEATSTTSDKN